MVPEAGGSSSFGRRAFNEFVSFGAGWALMLDYIVTVAISAYFVPNYLAVFWPVAQDVALQLDRRHRHHHLLVGLNVIGIKEAARLNIVLALLDLGTQILLMVLGVVLLLEPKLLIDQVHLGVAPTWTHLIYGISIGTIAYTGIETVSNMSEEAGQPGPGRAAGHQPRARRRPRRLPRHLDDRALGDAGQAQRARGRRHDRPDRPGRGRRQEQRRAQRPVRVQGRRRRPATPGSDVYVPAVEGGRHVGRSPPRTPGRRRSSRAARRTPRSTARSSAASTRRTRSSASCGSCPTTSAGSRPSSCPGSASWRPPSCSSPPTPA